MSWTVWKLTWDVGASAKDRQSFELPEGAEFLSAAEQKRGLWCIWVRVDQRRQKRWYTLQIVGTGQTAPHASVGRYVDTFMSDGGAFVWHLFDISPPALCSCRPFEAGVDPACPMHGGNPDMVEEEI